jgi:hypothetical protein
MATLGQNSSLPQLVRPVSLVLMPDSSDLSRLTGLYGYSYNAATQERADYDALKGCNSPGCKVVFRILPHRCGALATGEKGTSGMVAWGGKNNASTRDAAKLAALENCQKRTYGKCEVRVSECSR